MSRMSVNGHPLFTYRLTAKDDDDRLYEATVTSEEQHLGKRHADGVLNVLYGDTIAFKNTTADLLQ